MSTSATTGAIQPPPATATTPATTAKLVTTPTKPLQGIAPATLHGASFAPAPGLYKRHQIGETFTRDFKRKTYQFRVVGNRQLRLVAETVKLAPIGMRDRFGRFALNRWHRPWRWIALVTVAGVLACDEVCWFAVSNDYFDDVQAAMMEDDWEGAARIIEIAVAKDAGSNSSIADAPDEIIEYEVSGE